MTFPMLRDQNNTHSAEALFNKPKQMVSRSGGQVEGARAGSENFWTDTLVRAYLKR